VCDKSHCEKDETLALTLEPVEYCHQRVWLPRPSRVELHVGGWRGEDGRSRGRPNGTRARRRGLWALSIEMPATALSNEQNEHDPSGTTLNYDGLQSVHDAIGDGMRLVLDSADPFTKNISLTDAGMPVSSMSM
jgi:hypothetical protein